MKNIILISLAIVLSGCATGIKHLQTDEFISQAEQIEQMNSASWTTYIGSSRDRVYIEYSRVPYVGKKPKTIVYWTELNDLDPKLQERIKSRKSPWTPWVEQKEK